MPLSVGDKLGPYEIVAPIGKGGMGEVYRARDVRLGRDVAIKVSQERFSDRFEREARAVAALNHPNICQLYDVGTNYLVMELIEGESPKGPLPVEQALEYARQISDALEAAHEKGIVHRDLKPANIKVTPEGRVKVLDFGLAKTSQHDGQPYSAEDSPTFTINATQAGVILGTAAYMSPEQARGKNVDKRTDIWAFGVILYELVVGERPFKGDDLTEILASVVKEAPDLLKVPSKIRRLLAKCLEKDPRKRLRDIGDAWGFLNESAVIADRTRIWPWAAAVGVLGIAALVGWLRPGSAATDRPSLTFSIVAPSGITLAEAGTPMSAPELSPDGSALLFAATGGIYVRRLDSLEPRLVSGRLGTAQFWSQDSANVAFDATSGQLTRVRLPSGAPEVISSLPGNPRGGSWGDAGIVLISAFQGLSFPAFLSVITATEGNPHPVEMPMSLKQGSCYYPEFLPGGQDFLFVFVPSADSNHSAVYLSTLRDGKAVDPVLLFQSPTAARYTPAGGGRILFVRNDNLYSQKLNRQTRKLESESELVVEGVASQPSMATHHADFSVAHNGTVAWRPGKAAGSQVVEFDRSGNQLGTSGPSDQYTHLALSPDEKQLLVSSWEANWLVQVGRSGRLALPNGIHWFNWFEAGSRLIGGGNGAFVEMSASGSGEVRELRKFASAGLLVPPRISYDGKQVIAQTDRGVALVPLGGASEGTEPNVVIPSSDQVYSRSFSPNDRWLVYNTGDKGMYVRPFPDPGPRRQVATTGARLSFPLWRKDGKEILYTDRDSLMSIPVQWNGTPTFGAPRKLFSGLRKAAGLTADCNPLAVSQDGSRIFWIQGVEQPDSNVIHVKIGAVR
jgi:predicted Ser/Thr protein kinase